MKLLVAAVLAASALSAAPRKLLVISVDGMDARYLAEADRIGVKIPNLRKLRAEGAAATGVVGVVPTVTWPSHTTMLTGVTPDLHGIPTNDQPGKPGQRWWYTSFLTARTLWQEMIAQKRKTATVYWPVTLGAEVDYNFPEFWETRSEHDLLFDPIARHATKGLEERVTRVYPSFPKSRFDDLTALQATRYLLEFEQPEMLLVHIPDLDSEQHEHGAFSKHAKAVLERQDELIGWTLQKLPPDTVVAIVSDHGFENSEKLLRPQVMLREAGINEKAVKGEGLIGVTSEAAAKYFRGQVGKDGSGIAREVPMDEVRALAPSLKDWTAAFDTAPGYLIAADEKGPAVSPGTGKGTHGLWPKRANYRASFLLWGAGVRKADLGEISMLDIAPTFAEILEVKLPAATHASLWPRARK